MSLPFTATDSTSTLDAETVLVQLTFSRDDDDPDQPGQTIDMGKAEGRSQVVKLPAFRLSRWPGGWVHPVDP